MVSTEVGDTDYMNPFGKGQAAFFFRKRNSVVDTFVPWDFQTKPVRYKMASLPDSQRYHSGRHSKQSANTRRSRFLRHKQLF